MNRYNLEVSNGVLSYLDNDNDGEMGLKTLVCFHGNSSAAMAFKHIYKLLGDKYRIISVDLLGHGHSTPAKNPIEAYSIPGVGKMIGEFISSIKLTDYILVGHSLSGHAAIEILDDLVGVRGGIFVGAPPFNTELQQEIFRPDPTDGLLFTGKITEERISIFANNFLGDKVVDQDIRGEVEKHIILTNWDFRQYLGDSLSSGKFKDEVEILKRTNIPLAIIQGKEDRFIDSDKVETYFFEMGARVSTYAIEDCGHVPHLEKPAEFCDIVDSFVYSLV